MNIYQISNVVSLFKRSCHHMFKLWPVRVLVLLPMGGNARVTPMQEGLYSSAPSLATGVSAKEATEDHSFGEDAWKDGLSEHRTRGGRAVFLFTDTGSAVRRLAVAVLCCHYE
jgi:hypothetical protein